MKASLVRCFSRASKLILVLTLSLAIFAPAELSAQPKPLPSKRNRSTRLVHKSAPARPFSTVVIDAGHGGVDQGGIRQNIVSEKNVALDVAQRLEKFLRKAGLRTVMTRSDDRFVTLDRRVSIANAHHDAIFMSIHFNSARWARARGVETFHFAPSEATLAHRIQRNLVATTTGDDRGVKRARFRVLRQTKIRAVLAECGFLTNPQDAALARNARYRAKIAQQISRAIVEDRNSLR